MRDMVNTRDAWLKSSSILAFLGPLAATFRNGWQVSLPLDTTHA